MSKTVMSLLFFSVALSIAGASPHGAHHDMPYQEEVESIVADYRDREIGSLTVGELEEMMERLSVPAHKSAYVSRSRTASYLVPGLGQFKNDAPGAGALFLLADAALKVGTVVGSYLLLPEELGFTAIDYLRTPYADIESVWYSQSFLALAPATAVAAGGSMLQGILRMVSASHAGRLAADRIDSGAVSFDREDGRRR
jgi:hypothetical protein